MASGGPLEFRRWLDKQIDKEIPNWQSKLHRTLHLQVVGATMGGGLRSGVVDSSPVGDPDQWLSLRPRSNIATRKVTRRKAPSGYTGGRFRGNWQSSHPSDSKRQEVRQAEMRSESEVKGQNSRDISTLRAYSRSYLVNNVPYSIRLAEGWSRQAPNGWVEDVIDRVAAQFGRQP